MVCGVVMGGVINLKKSFTSSVNDHGVDEEEGTT